jgi:hypothetical protein
MLFIFFFKLLRKKRLNPLFKSGNFIKKGENMMQVGTTIGLETLDATLIFQILNTLFLILIVLGVPIIIILIIRALKRKNTHMESIHDKLDLILDKLDKND